MKVRRKFEKCINFSLISNCVIFNVLAGSGGDNKNKDCKCYGFQKNINNEIKDINIETNTNIEKEKEKEKEKDKKEEENNEKKNDENDKKGEEDPLKDKKSILKNKLKEVNENNNKLEEKDKIEINIKENNIDECKDDKSLDKISKDLDDLNVKILNKINEKNKELAKQIIINKRNEIIELFNKVDDLIKKIREIIDNTFRIKITKDKIQKEEDIKNLNKIESDLNKQKLELTEFYKKITTDTPICKDQNEFITKFNERKNILADRFNDDLKNKLKANNLKADKISDYFTMYQEMTNDIFNHEISLDLQIYRYILNLEGFTNALDNIIKKDKIRYDFFVEYSNKRSGYNTEIFKKDDNYYLDYYSSIDTKEYKEDRYIYSGIFYVNEKPFKYVRCNDINCKDNNCISCKLKKLLEKENIGDLYKKIYKEYGASSNTGSTVRCFIYNHINSKYKNEKNFRDIFEFTDYELEKNRNEKKVLMLEWALTIEFMKRFILEFTGKKEFYLYRTMGFSDTNYKPTNELLSQAVDSTSLFGPCYFEMSSNTIICFYKIKAKLYCCFFNHIINPFPIEDKYKQGVKDKSKKHIMFLKGKLLGDYECEIGYIPVNQKYTEEVKYNKDIEKELENLQNYIYDRTVENFKQNMLNNETTKNAKLHVFKGDKTEDLK